MKKKKGNKIKTEPHPAGEHKKLVDTELLRMYMMGAANPSHSNKNPNYSVSEVIDLHLHENQSGAGKIRTGDILFHQLEQFEKALDTALATGKMEIRVIHGLGKGKLKEAIYKILEKHPHVKSYKNDYHSQYGFGSTVIHFY